MTATSRPASRSTTPRSEGSTPPDGSSPTTQKVGSSVDSSGLGRGFWYCPEGRAFFSLSETPSETAPLCDLVASLPGPFTLLAKNPSASEQELTQAAKSHLDNLGLTAEQRSRSFPVVLDRITSAGTWLDLETGKAISAPQQHWKERFHGIVSMGRTQPAFVRISPEGLPEKSTPSMQDIRDWTDAMRELAMRAGIPSNFINF